jgi:diaminohydroxyphosphoribosylaminopyrimidine deaminase/5-amino-6-(5-phosphoribosylamino)uracil reductase
VNQDEIYMQRAIELARLGAGSVAPNPMVGAVIVHNDLIIGEGYHHKFGEPHAEVNAINSVQENNLLSSATIYVTLEPCSHHGKTPPCCDLLIRHRFKRVVIGCLDTHAKVNGKGVDKLQKAGVHFMLHKKQ